MQNAKGGFSGGVGFMGEFLWRNDPWRGGTRHSSRCDDCRRNALLAGVGVSVPGGGTTFGKPTIGRKEENLLVWFKTVNLHHCQL